VNHPTAPGTVIETTSPTSHGDARYGVVVASTSTHVVAYFPGTSTRFVAPSSASALRVVAATAVTRWCTFAECDPAWVVHTWDNLRPVREELHAPQAIALWELAAEVARTRHTLDYTSLISPGQWDCWAGRELSSDDLASLEEAIPNSSITDTD
jgi:hypothetical protein